MTGACANQAPPPGGPEDRRPPVVVGTEPDTFGEMVDLDGSVRFQFDERISEQVTEGDLSTAVTVSPLTGEVHVSHGRSSLEVSLEGGFRPGLVYRVTLQPVVSDMFGNRLRDAFELVFTTGGQLGPTATLAGEVWDRISGRGVSGATVYAVGADSLINVARADNSGVFAFRYLPLGDLTVTAFQDNNRDTEVSPREPRGTTTESVVAGDTVLVDIPVLAPDTTPAVAGGASALDSMTIVVQFDDYLDPDAPVDGITVDLTREDAEAPTVTRLFQEAGYARFVEQVADSFSRVDSIEAAARAAAGDTAAADSSVVDSVAAAAADSVGGDRRTRAQGRTQAPERRGPPRLDGAPSTRDTLPGRTPPGQRLVGILDQPLQEGEYQVRVSAVVNLNGLGGGGGDVTLAYEPPPPPADTTSQGDDDAADAPSDGDAPGPDADAGAAPDGNRPGPNP